MEQWERLETERHAQLTVARTPESQRHFVQLVPSEFAAAALHYPILFTKHPETGGFFAGAILGVKPGENLCTGADGLLTGYRPADLERHGFFLVEGEIVIRRDDPVFAGAGQPLFDAGGEATPAFQRIRRALGQLQAGLPETEALVARLLALKLIEPIDVTLHFDDGERLVLDGLYTVSLDALHELPDAEVLALFRDGTLHLAYTQAQSVGHLRTLAARRNERLASGFGG
ncbi:SapC family protein [Sphingomonas sp. S-NIH.Pt15_0812]|jgi:hypothetical protein|uniref:SapC family protein n=1 Tax=Sphingomonas sp. S-NIH.Pt15_0812 TaxID=1920129 RepID=UPI000F7EDBBF|nr:SapC family protein [Sphingomonas sp. S-NIH.Pt15_0812]RSU50513.1 multidrug transporter [Sphingomonas sp. S-NIH.Pt15_0812]